MSEVPDVITLDGVSYKLSPDQKVAVARAWKEYQEKWLEAYELHRRNLAARGLLGKVLDGGSMPEERGLLPEYWEKVRAIVNGEVS